MALVDGKLKALVKDNVNFKTYNLCIKVTAESDYDSKDFKMTYETFCDPTN